MVEISIMMDVDGWTRIEAADDIFASYEQEETRTTISIRRGDDWPETVAITVTANNDAETICRKELTTDAVQWATEYMQSIQCSGDGNGHNAPSARSLLRQERNPTRD